MNELITGLVKKVGLDEETAKKVVSFLQENASQVPQWLASSGLANKVPDSIKSKLPGGLGNLF
ncbi:MAG: hypothetical protein H6713_12675 [Myxococcales bacterium]|nr:hypothetical protein [Myxococcales bacterium]